MPRVLGGSRGAGHFLMGEVPLYHGWKYTMPLFFLLVLLEKFDMMVTTERDRFEVVLGGRRSSGGLRGGGADTRLCSLHFYPQDTPTLVLIPRSIDNEYDFGDPRTDFGVS